MSTLICVGKVPASTLCKMCTVVPMSRSNEPVFFVFCHLSVSMSQLSAISLFLCLGSLHQSSLFSAISLFLCLGSLHQSPLFSAISLFLCLSSLHQSPLFSAISLFLCLGSLHQSSLFSAISLFLCLSSLHQSFVFHSGCLSRPSRDIDSIILFYLAVTQ